VVGHPGCGTVRRRGRRGGLATGGTLLLDMDGAPRFGRGSAGGLGGALRLCRRRRSWLGLSGRTSGRARAKRTRLRTRLVPHFLRIHHLPVRLLLVVGIGQRVDCRYGHDVWNLEIRIKRSRIGAVGRTLYKGLSNPNVWARALYAPLKHNVCRLGEPRAVGCSKIRR
jgi:hypothetical protein